MGDQNLVLSPKGLPLYPKKIGVVADLVVNTETLVSDLRKLIEESRGRAARKVNAELSLLYWNVGRRLRLDILMEERAEYGGQILATISKALKNEYGRGWSVTQLRYCLRFAEVFPEEIPHTLYEELSWSHIKLLLYIEDDLKRQFYSEMCLLESWSVRQLSERKESMLFERTAISKRPEETIQLELEKLRTERAVHPDILLKDPYVLDFLGINDHYLEKDLEDAILRELEQFLLELGAGFTFVARQKRIQLDNDDFYLDLLFYNRKLKRLVVIDLKIGSFKAEFKGQMELYLRWLAKHEVEPGEEPPLGIILCTGKKSQQIELLELDKSGIHVAEYLTVLPPRQELEAKLERALLSAERRLENSTDDSDSRLIQS
jgi:predicted nuclease of restriction endonuclease-like (RecB) superfamily